MLHTCANPRAPLLLQGRLRLRLVLRLPLRPPVASAVAAGLLGCVVAQYCSCQHHMAVLAICYAVPCLFHCILVSAGVAYNINIPGYGIVTSSSPGTTGASTTTPGTDPTTQFNFYNATDPTSPLPILSGSPAIIQNDGTGKFCRLVPVQGYAPPTVALAKVRSRLSSTALPRKTSAAAAPPGYLLVLQCDVTDPSQATPLTYNTSGLSYNGQPVLPLGPGGQMAVMPPGTPRPDRKSVV